ncbi:MAG: glycosyltransferase [Patescibacteria group bacterium]|jgi:glycosyltransferase involved in cell wall biosynthesis
MKSNEKILLLITKAEVGGAQNFVANLAKGLKESGREVSIAAGEGEYLSEYAHDQQINFFRIKDLKRGFSFLANLSFLRNSLKYIKENKFDVIHLNSTNTLLLAPFLKIFSKKTKIVFTVHGLSVLDPGYEDNILKKLLFFIFFKFNLLFVNEIVFVSENNLKIAQKNKITNRGIVIYNGAEVDFYNREVAREYLIEKSKILEDSFLIGSVGRLAYPKNYEFLINNFKEVLGEIPNAKLILIGDGPNREKYQKLIGERGLDNDVLLLGEIVDAAKYLKGLDLFVLPSIYEGLSISLIETVLAKVPAIASDVGGNYEVIGKESCFRLNNKESFLEILKLVSNKSSIQDPKKFSLNTMVTKYLEIYKK